MSPNEIIKFRFLAIYEMYKLDLNYCRCYYLMHIDIYLLRSDSILFTFLLLCSGDLSVSIRKKMNNLLYVDLMKSDHMDIVNLGDSLIFLGFARGSESENYNFKVSLIVIFKFRTCSCTGWS